MPQAREVPGREVDDHGVDVDADAVHVGGRRGHVPEVDARPASHGQHAAGAPGLDEVDEERAEHRLGDPRRAGHELAVPVEVLAARGPVQPLAEAQVDVGAVGRGLLGQCGQPVDLVVHHRPGHRAAEPPPAVVLRQRPDRLAHVQEPVEQADVDDPQRVGPARRASAAGRARRSRRTRLPFPGTRPAASRRSHEPAPRAPACAAAGSPPARGRPDTPRAHHDAAGPAVTATLAANVRSGGRSTGARRRPTRPTARGTPRRGTGPCPGGAGRPAAP